MKRNTTFKLEKKGKLEPGSQLLWYCYLLPLTWLQQQNPTYFWHLQCGLSHNLLVSLLFFLRWEVVGLVFFFFFLSTAGYKQVMWFKLLVAVWIEGYWSWWWELLVLTKSWSNQQTKDYFFFFKTRDIPEIKMMKKSETCTFFPFLYVEDKKTDIILTTLLISDMTIAAPFKT